MQWREIIINQTHVFEGILYDPPSIVTAMLKSI